MRAVATGFVSVIRIGAFVEKRPKRGRSGINRRIHQRLESKSSTVLQDVGAIMPYAPRSVAVPHRV